MTQVDKILAAYYNIFILYPVCIILYSGRAAYE